MTYFLRAFALMPNVVSDRIDAIPSEFRQLPIKRRQQGKKGDMRGQTGRWGVDLSMDQWG
jgi:hypothetical protein